MKKPTDPRALAASQIKQAWIAAVCSGAITLVVANAAMVGTSLSGFTGAWELIDVALIFGLAYGIYRKSRACAVAMLVYFIISKIVIVATTGQAAGIALAAVFCIFFVRGVTGTFAHHKLLESESATQASA